jgi:hypothetical protein
MTNLSKFQGVATTVRVAPTGEIIGQYQRTDVAKKQHNNIQLNTGGWFTRTTKVRMNQFANHFCNGRFSVYQKNHEWFVRLADGTVLPFNDRVIDFTI